MKFKLVENINFINEGYRSESIFKEPSKIAIKISSPYYQPYELSDILSKKLSNIYLPLEIMVDNSDGSYIIMTPGRQDWLKAISDTVMDSLNNKASIETLF